MCTLQSYSHVPMTFDAKNILPVYIKLDRAIKCHVTQHECGDVKSSSSGDGGGVVMRRGGIKLECNQIISFLFVFNFK